MGKQKDKHVSIERDLINPNSPHAVAVRGHHFANAWRRACCNPTQPAQPDPFRLPSPDSIIATEWSSQFEALMKNRLVTGAARYGFATCRDSFHGYDIAASIQQRLAAYIRGTHASVSKRANAHDANSINANPLEPLIDIANLAMLEFIQRTRTGRFVIGATDDLQGSDIGHVATMGADSVSEKHQ